MHDLSIIDSHRVLAMSVSLLIFLTCLRKKRLPQAVLEVIQSPRGVMNTRRALSCCTTVHANRNPLDANSKPMNYSTLTYLVAVLILRLGVIKF